MDPNQQQQPQPRTNNRQGRNRRQRGGGRTPPSQGTSFDTTAATNQLDAPSSRESSPGPPRVLSNVAISQDVPLARTSNEITRVVVQNPSQTRPSFQGLSQSFNPNKSKSTDADELIILSNNAEEMSPIEPKGMLPFTTSPNEQSDPFGLFLNINSQSSGELPIHEPFNPSPRGSTEKPKPPASPLQIQPSVLLHAEYDPKNSSESTRATSQIYQPEGRRSPNLSDTRPLSPNNSVTIGKSISEKADWLYQDNNPESILIPPDLQDRSCKFCKQSHTDKYETIPIDGTRKIKKGRLFSPCKCAGNMNYAHVGCLLQKQQASYRCEKCQYLYRFYRITLGSFLASRPLVHILTVILLFGLLYGTGWIAKVVDIDVIHDSKTLPEFLLLNVWHWLIGLLVITFIGLVFLMYQAVLNGTRGLRSLYMWACPCFVGLPGFRSAAEKKPSRLNFSLMVLFLIVFTPLGVIALISGTYVLFQRSINRVLWRFGDGILNVKKRNE